MDNPTNPPPQPENTPGRGIGNLSSVDIGGKINELVAEIQSLSPGQREKLMQLANKTYHTQEKLQQSAGRLHESIDYLRVSIKYLLFDLEATRRENAYLKKLLEEGPNRGGNYGNNG